jgi:glycosyl transferase family 87
MSRANRRRAGDKSPPLAAAGTGAVDRARWPSWTTAALYLVALGIVTLVFLPWLLNYVHGQYAGAATDYGTDFYRYAMGSQALFELGLDPYSNAAVLQAIRDQRIESDHPRPFYDVEMSATSFGPSFDPIAKGVVSPPLVLVCHYALVRLCGYTLALHAWLVVSLLAFGWLSLLFWRRLLPQLPVHQRWASHAAMLSLLVLASFPVLWSLLYGQHDILYVLTLGGAIYLWSFFREHRATPLLVGLLLGVAGAAKIFPLVMLGYFVLKALPAPASASHSGPQPDAAGWVSRKPEIKVVLFGVLFFLAINIALGFAFGWGLYQSFLGKLGDLTVEGPSTSTKCNLLSYLHFLPIWLAGPFSPMTRSLAFLYPLVSVVVLLAGALLIRSNPGASDERQQPMIRLLEMSLIVAALPTVLPHWWINYNVLFIIPLLACFAACMRIEHIAARRVILLLTVAALALSFSYLTTTTLFHHFPALYHVIINQGGVERAIAAAAKDPELLQHLTYSTALGRPFVPEIEGRVPSLFNFLYGYPGTVLLTIASGLALRQIAMERAATGSRGVTVGAAPLSESSAPLSRREALGTLAGGTILVCTGAYAIRQYGRFKLAKYPAVIVVLDRHALENPALYIDPQFDRLRRAASGKASAELGGLVADILPPAHFLEFLLEKDAAIARAFLSRDRAFFQDEELGATGGTRIVSLFDDHQRELNRQYAAWFQAGSTAPIPAQRQSGLSGGLLALLEQKCRAERLVPRRIDMEWTEWELWFLCELSWQRAVAALGEKNLAHFGRLVSVHQDALRRFKAARERHIEQLEHSLAQDPSTLPDQGAVFFFVQQPAFTALASYPAFDMISPQTPVATSQTVAVCYVVEELLRRSRLAKSLDGFEALRFASEKADSLAGRLQQGGIDAWRGRLVQRAAASEQFGSREVLESLVQAGLIKAGDVETDSLFTLDSGLAQMAADPAAAQ